MSRPVHRVRSIRPTLRSRRHLAVIAAVAVVALAGCASGSDDSPESDSLGAYDQAAAAPLAEEAAGGSMADSAETTSDSSAQLSQASLAAERRQIMTAGLVVETDSVLTSARQAETIAIGAGGFVADEDTQVDQRPDGEIDGTVVYTVSSLTLRVPPTALDDALESLANLGTLVSQNRATTDVTDEYVDVAARLASQRASLDRLLQLVGTAGDLDDVVSLENEIARRQADLDGLAARLQSLEEETDLATISLTLTSEPPAPVATKSDDGFVAGLSSGWNAFTDSVVAALTVVGAVLPFAALIALFAIPWFVIRRRRVTTVIGSDGPSTAPPTAQA